MKSSNLDAPVVQRAGHEAFWEGCKVDANLCQIDQKFRFCFASSIFGLFFFLVTLLLLLTSCRAHSFISCVTSTAPPPTKLHTCLPHTYPPPPPPPPAPSPSVIPSTSSLKLLVCTLITLLFYCFQARLSRC